MTRFEQIIEFNYLNQKMNKFSDFNRLSYESLRCVFSMKNFKRVNFLVNFQDRNLEYYDDYQPIMWVDS